MKTYSVQKTVRTVSERVTTGGKVMKVISARRVTVKSGLSWDAAKALRATDKTYFIVPEKGTKEEWPC